MVFRFKENNIESITEQFARMGLHIEEMYEADAQVNDDLEEAMSPIEAMEVLGLSAEEAGDSATVKKAYREASRKHHPDLGGDPEEMKKVNAAYEALKGGGIAGSGRAGGVDWEKMRQDYRERAAFVKEYLKNEVNVDAFVEYLKQWEPNLEVTTSFFPKEGTYDPHAAGMRVRMATPTGERVLRVEFYCNLTNLKTEGALGAGDITIPLMVTTYLYVDGKDQKIKQQNYTFTSDKAVIVEPSSVFPKARMGKIFSGQARKGSKFSRRDMLGALVNELNARVEGSEPYAHIPIGEDAEGNILELVLYRTVFMRMPAWSSAGVWRNKNGISRMIKDAYVTMMFPETYDTVSKLKEIRSKVKDMAPEEKIPAVIDWLKQERAALDSE